MGHSIGIEMPLHLCFGVLPVWGNAETLVRQVLPCPLKCSARVQRHFPNLGNAVALVFGPSFFWEMPFHWCLGISNSIGSPFHGCLGFSNGFDFSILFVLSSLAGVSTRHHRKSRSKDLSRRDPAVLIIG